jgi:predicted nucleic acid-binding protein
MIAVGEAFDWSHQGLDFADALYLASASSARQFATFDRKLARQASGTTTLKTICL